MTYEITTAFVQNYKNNIEMLLQQQGGKLASLVTNDTYVGKAGKVVEQFGPVAASKNLSRYADTPLNPPPQDARWVYPNDYEWGALIDEQDKLRMIIDPTSAYAMNAVNALRRSQDEEILLAFFGDSKTGENGATTTSFPSGNIVAATHGSGSTASGMSVAKLREAKRLLMKAGVDIDTDPLYCAITSYEHDYLLNEAQAISLDYTTKPVLEEGRIRSFMGFNFVHVEYEDSTSYPQASASLVNSSSQQLVPCWAKSGMHLGTWEDVNASVDRRPDKRNAVQVYTKCTYGATRLQENKVIQVVCAR